MVVELALGMHVRMLLAGCRRVSLPGLRSPIQTRSPQNAAEETRIESTPCFVPSLSVSLLSSLSVLPHILSIFALRPPPSSITRSFTCTPPGLAGGPVEPRKNLYRFDENWNESQVAALLSSKPAADGDEEKDEGGFGASVAMSESSRDSAFGVDFSWMFVHV